MAFRPGSTRDSRIVPARLLGVVPPTKPVETRVGDDPTHGSFAASRAPGAARRGAGDGNRTRASLLGKETPHHAAPAFERAAGIEPARYGLENRPLTLRMPAWSPERESNPYLALTKGVLDLRATRAFVEQVGIEPTASRLQSVTAPQCLPRCGAYRIRTGVSALPARRPPAGRRPHGPDIRSIATPCRLERPGYPKRSSPEKRSGGTDESRTRISALRRQRLPIGRRPQGPPARSCEGSRGLPRALYSRVPLTRNSLSAPRMLRDDVNRRRRARKESNPPPRFWRPRCCLSSSPWCALVESQIMVPLRARGAAYGSRTRLTGVTSQPRHRSRHAALVSPERVERSRAGLGNLPPGPPEERLGWRTGFDPAVDAFTERRVHQLPHATIVGAA